MTHHQNPNVDRNFPIFSHLSRWIPLVRIVASRPSAQDMPGQRLQLGPSPPSSPGHSQRELVTENGQMLQV